MEITYEIGIVPPVEKIVDLYQTSGINRPVLDFKRIEEMYKNSNLVVSAWDGDDLVGISRSLTDFSYCCYLSDLAVRNVFQRKGIGKKLIELTKAKIGPQCMLLLLSAPGAVNFYPKIGFKKVDNGFIINRLE
jgi:predicted N-acetyltransferase YhbS